MTNIKMPHTNRVFKAPKEWNEKHGECTDLYGSEYEDIIYSYYKPSLKEKLLILLGWPVRLCIASSIQPPVAIDVEKR